MSFLTWLGLQKIMDDTDPKNVIKLPTIPRLVPPVPAPEKPAKIFYKIGVTDNNRVSFSLNYTGEILMNKQGIQNLIDQLEVFMNQLHDEDPEPEDEDHGGHRA